MSLKDLAQQMKSTGRKGDTELVHMTKGEVAGLQALAEAAGGTLTKNPQTGLPEASFLEQLLPTIIGVGVGMFAGPMAGAAAGAAVGGIQNKEDPLMGALMGGIGGYGGAGLGAGLSSAGTAATTAGSVAPTEVAKSLGTTATTPGSQASLIAAQNAGVPTEALTSYGNALSPAPLASTAAPVTFSNMGQGIQSLFSNPSDALTAMGGGFNVAKNVGFGLAPMLYSSMMPKQGPVEMPEEEKDEEDLMGRYEYRANPTGGTRPTGSAFTGERVYFEPEYRRTFAAQGGEVKKYADGGEASASSSEVDPARGMTGMSRDALLYLYGQTPSATQEAVYPAIPVVEFGPIQNYDYFAPKPAPEPERYRSLFGIPVLGSAPFTDEYGQPVYGNPAWSEYGYSPFSNARESSSLFGGSSFRGGSSSGFAEGGIADLAKGGMKAGGFVVPADVVSMVGEGNTDAGYERIKRMLPGATPIKGKDGGQADTVETSIEGKQPARIAHGEMYVPPATVKRAGGAKKLYAMMDKVRKQAKGDTKQIKPVNLKKALA